MFPSLKHTLKLSPNPPSALHPPPIHLTSLLTLKFCTHFKLSLIQPPYSARSPLSPSPHLSFASQPGKETPAARGTLWAPGEDSQGTNVGSGRSGLIGRVPKLQTSLTKIGNIRQINVWNCPDSTEDTSLEAWEHPGPVDRGGSVQQLSGEEMDLLNKILKSLTIETKRPRHSSDCCHWGDQDSCFSLVRASPFNCPSNSPAPSHLKITHCLSLHPYTTKPNIPGRSRWQSDVERPTEPQPQSLPADLSSLNNTQSLDATSSSKIPNSQLPSPNCSREEDQEDQKKTD
jgi:hypothetical protein